MKNKIKTIILFTVIVSFLMGLTSCKKEIKEIELNGSRMSTKQLEKYVGDFNDYKSAEEDGSRRRNISSNWYNFSSAYKLKKDGKDSSVNADININGEFYDAFSPMDLKMKIKMDMDMDVSSTKEEKKYDSKYKCKLTMILVDGIWWIKGKTVLDMGKKVKISSQICKKEKYNSDLSFDSDIIFEETSALEYIKEMLFFIDKKGSIMEELGSTFILDLKNYLGEGDNRKVFKEENTLYKSKSIQEKTNSVVERQKYEFEKNSYIPKNIEVYEHTKTLDSNTSEESTICTKISKKMMGIIGAPINKNKYGW